MADLDFADQTNLDSELTAITSMELSFTMPSRHLSITEFLTNSVSVSAILL